MLAADLEGSAAELAVCFGSGNGPHGPEAYAWELSPLFSSRGLRSRTLRIASAFPTTHSSSCPKALQSRITVLEFPPQPGHTALADTPSVWVSRPAFGDETFSVAVLDDDKVGVSLGVSWHFSQFRFDLAAARIFQGRREVTTSELRQVNPTNPGQASVIGNGVYQSNFWVAGAGINWIYE